jgi:hypothetical protein
MVGLAILATSLAAASPAVDASDDQLLVNEAKLEQGRPGVVHVVVDTPPGAGGDALTIHLTVEGPGSRDEVHVTEQRRSVDDQLVTVPWTPTQTGNHTLRAEIDLGDRTRLVEERTVFVPAASSSADSSAGVLPHSAPGTVQWAIAFGILFFVTRASLGHRSRRS